MRSLGSLEADGLFTPTVRDWADRKYRLISYYAEMFSTAMKVKWEHRVYIDLFAGAGRGRIEGASRILATSPLLAMSVRDPFDRYVFCDVNPKCIDALRTRVEREFPDRRTEYVTGDCNRSVDEIFDKLPRGRRDARVLSFCFVDPYKMANLKFSTLGRLSSIFVDFLILIPSYMDANRNQRAYMAQDNTTVAEFLGNPDWRSEWADGRGEFGAFIVDQFGRSMKRLGFIYEGPGEEVTIRLPRKNVKLYHLAFYSKSERGMDFWRKARRGSDDQLGFFE